LHGQIVRITADAPGIVGASRHAQDRRQFAPNLDTQAVARNRCEFGTPRQR
jgi:hypothetical protein